MPFASDVLTRVIESPFAGPRPLDVSALVLLRGSELEAYEVFDQPVAHIFDDPAIGVRLQGTLTGVRDFMRDSYGGDGCICMQVDGIWMAGVELGEHLLVAMCRPDADIHVVEAWLLRLAPVLAPWV